MGGIIPGSAFIDKFQPKIYIKEYTTAWTKYDTKALLETALDGVAGVNTVTMPGTAAAMEQTQFYHYTPARTYGVWYKISTADLATAKAKATLDNVTVDYWIQVDIPSTLTVDTVIASLTQAAIAAVSNIDVTASVAGAILTLTNKYGGLATATADSANVPTGATFANTTPATGNWTPATKAESNPIMSVEEGDSFDDSEGGSHELTRTVTVEFNLASVNAGNAKYAEDNFDSKQVSIAYYDPNLNGGSVQVIDDVPCKVMTDLTGEVKFIKFRSSLSASVATVKGKLSYDDYSV